ncbi:EF-hand calcium-binding domain-containing protein 11 isoform X2 [Hippopotamus amphibius kiboko]|uniref:EF-hand calcium-binding domain-containing protein 11 isoform X2 n=1 Tax=Hippopotamus amphibius kiboko TaxID=575201 RepID=UPI002599A637|nr:EF-hand calcium-binding domain-containing protein 11 isoform X2 [Hippopotamus amphibius kiboko]
MFFSQAGSRPRMWEASPSEHKKWVEVFKACDEDNKGYLSREDFKVAVVMLFGYKPSKIEADSVMSSVDPNTSGILLKEFLDIVRKKKEAQVYRNEIRHIFTAFDRHYRGYLTLEDFKKAFKQVAPKLSERIILEVFREVDQDSDGHVSFKDFEYAMNYGQKQGLKESPSRPKETFLQRRHAGGQEAHEKMLNITNY